MELEFMVSVKEASMRDYMEQEMEFNTRSLGESDIIWNRIINSSLITN